MTLFVLPDVGVQIEPQKIFGSLIDIRTGSTTTTNIYSSFHPQEKAS
jgi:hypothetical protein